MAVVSMNEFDERSFLVNGGGGTRRPGTRVPAVIDYVSGMAKTYRGGGGESPYIYLGNTYVYIFPVPRKPFRHTRPHTGFKASKRTDASFDHQSLSHTPSNLCIMYV